MRIVAVVAVGLLLLPACAQEAAEDAAPPAEAVAGPAVNVADYVGTWTGTANLPGSPPVASTFNVASDGSGTLMLPDREPIPVQLTISGDSLVATSAEYESVLRPGVRVLTRTASVKSGESMAGSIVATYRTTASDSVVIGTSEHTRDPQ
jgi:hypothetical protein